MITVRYNYNQQVQPPAPFIYVTVGAPNHRTERENIPVLIDTGADITAIPIDLVTDLGLIKFSEIVAGGFRHGAEPVDTFLVTLQIHNWTIDAVEVVLSDDNYGIFGRDVLNQFLITLDGPDLTLTMGRPAKGPDQPEG